MGLLDFLSSSKRPPSGTPQLSQQEVLETLRNLNRPTAPYHLIDGKAEGVDFIAKWKIDDPRWTQVFAKAGLKGVFKIYLKLDPPGHEVRASDREYLVSWKVSPELKMKKKLGEGAEEGVKTSMEFTLLEAKGFRGQKQSIKFGTSYAYTETTATGEVHNYRFTPQEIKKPIQDAVIACGWTYRGVAFRKL